MQDGGNTLSRVLQPRQALHIAVGIASDDGMGSMPSLWRGREKGHSTLTLTQQSYDNSSGMTSDKEQQLTHMELWANVDWSL